jgi:hypothetical protein
MLFQETLSFAESRTVTSLQTQLFGAGTFILDNYTTLTGVLKLERFDVIVQDNALFLLLSAACHCQALVNLPTPFRNQQIYSPSTGVPKLDFKPTLGLGPIHQFLFKQFTALESRIIPKGGKTKPCETLPHV